MITNQPLHHHQMIPIKNENVDFSILEKNQTKIKRKTLNTTFSSKSLTTETLNLDEKNKFFSNSLDSCLNMKTSKFFKEF